MNRILAIARIELLRLLRSRATFTLLLLVPAMQVLLFGYAIRPTPAHITIAVAAPTPADAQRMTTSLAQVAGLVIMPEQRGPGTAEAAVREGRALIGIEVPELRSLIGDEVPALRAGASPTQAQSPLRIVVDATNAGLTGAAVAEIESTYWRNLAEQGGVAALSPGFRVERLFNPESRADWTFLPALIGVTVMIAMVMLGSLGVARERETGTWEALLALPISPIEVLVGKMLPYVVIGTAQGVLVLGAGIGLFDLPARGTVGALIALLPLFAAAHLALGHAISARARTQVAALQGAVAFYLPSMLLSGFLYPFEALPDWARRVGSVFPLTHFIRAAREALLRGSGAAPVLAHGVPIAAFLVLAVAVTLLASSREPD